MIKQIILVLITLIIGIKLNIIQPTGIKIRQIPKIPYVYTQPKLTSIFSLYFNPINKQIRRISGSNLPASNFQLKVRSSIFQPFEVENLSQIPMNLIEDLKDYDIKYLKQGQYLSIEFNWTPIFGPIYVLVASLKLRKWSKGQVEKCISVRQRGRCTVIGNGVFE